MRDKKSLVLILLLAVVFAVAVFWISLDREDIEKIRSLTYNDYEKMLAKETSPYTMEDIQNSEAAYLLDPAFEITEDNVPDVMNDFFSAPARLSFTIFASEKFADLAEKEYKCDDLKENAAFGRIFADKNFVETDISALSLDDVSSYLFHNDLGFIVISCYEGSTYIEFNEFSFAEYRFRVEEDLSSEIESIIENIFPYSMEIFSMA